MSLIPLTRPYVRRKEWDKALDLMIHDQWTPGELSEKLARDFARSWGCNEAWSFGNEASAMRYLWRSLGLLPGDKVILSPLANPLWAQVLEEWGALPLWADTRSDCPVLDTASVKALLEQNPRAVISDTALGFLPDLVTLKALGVFLIEDITHGWGGIRDQLQAGQGGDAVFISLGKESLITAGRGAVVGVRTAKHLGTFFSKKPLTDDLLPPPNAALALGMWPQKEELSEKRKEHRHRLFQKLAKSHRQPHQEGDAEIAPPWFSLILVQGAREAQSYAERKGVECRAPFAGLSETLADCPNARYLALHTLIFPLPVVLTAKEEEILGKVLATLP